MSYETRQCGHCTDGIAWSCGNRPEDRREISTCIRCNGSGEVTVFVYVTSEGESA
jgi:hypothetical protein